MAIKEKNKQEVAPGQGQGNQPRINPELDARLTVYMASNQRTTDYYATLVKENPERAVRSLMLPKMLKHEDQMRLVEKQMPAVEEWVKQQPGMMEKIKERIKNVTPINQAKAFVGEAMKLKSRIDFTPRVGVGASVST